MKKIVCILCTLLMLLTVISVPSALAMEIDYSGDWVCLTVDLGDGVLLTEYEGQPLPETIFFTLQPDGVVVLTSMGEQQEGIWQKTGAGISIIADNTIIPFTNTDNQLVNTDQGVTMVFTRAENVKKVGGFSTLVNLGKNAAPAFEYAGEWHAISYEAMGISSGIDAFFPDGLFVTLAADGTGTVQLTPDYTEAITWAQTDSGISMDGSNFLYDPLWDPQMQTLSLCYASDVIRIVFEKTIGTEQTPTAMPEITLVPEITPAPAAAGTLPQAYTCTFFNAAFPDGWVQDEYNTYNYDTYYSAQYNLNDQDNWTISNVRIEASVDEVANYRYALDTLTQTAAAAGIETLEQRQIGGYDFVGAVTGDYWLTGTYLARVPEASMTLTITISEPGKIEEVLPAILDSVLFTFPIPNPPLMDPPLPEDGVPYQPSTGAVSVGGYTLQAQWLPAGDSIIPKDAYYNGMAAVGEKVYLLTSQLLRSYTRNGNQLVSAGEPLDLGDNYSYLSAAQDGTLFITDGYYRVLAVKDGATNSYDLDSYLAIHPDGQWGLGFWSSYNVKRLTFSADGMATQDWILTNLDNDAARTGRFSTISYITITADRIFVAGMDTQAGNATRIAMYDLDGNELATFGGKDWSEDSYFGNVTGIVQTKNGIIALDGYYQTFRLFSLDGTYLGSAHCDELLGTNYPWPVTLVPTEGGALALISQERADQSATELLVFEITGF